MEMTRRKGMKMMKALIRGKEKRRRRIDRIIDINEFVVLIFEEIFMIFLMSFAEILLA